MANTTTPLASTEEYTLGSGDIFILEYTDAIKDSITPTYVCENGARVGEVKSGASLEYKVEIKEESADLGRTKITVLSKEDVTLKSGLMTWSGTSIEKLCSTARITSEGSGAAKKRITKIGGLANNSKKKYAVGFEYKGEGKTGLRVCIVGKNAAGFTISFDPDNATVIDAEFKAQAIDDDGTLVIIEESTPEAGG